MWSFASSFCNAEISSISNAIITTFCGLILGLNSFIWKLLAFDGLLTIDDELKTAILSNGISVDGFCEVAVNIFFYPIFAMGSMGALISLIKLYWLKKNNIKDFDCS